LLDRAIEIITIDEFYSENQLEGIDILKLDVHGSELDNLKGSKT
jgi:FkbM family methyltransferase